MCGKAPRWRGWDEGTRHEEGVGVRMRDAMGAHGRGGGRRAYTWPPSSFELSVMTPAPHQTMTKTPVKTTADCDDGAVALSILFSAHATKGRRML